MLPEPRWLHTTMVLNFANVVPNLNIYIQVITLELRGRPVSIKVTSTCEWSHLTMLLSYTSGPGLSAHVMQTSQPQTFPYLYCLLRRVTPQGFMEPYCILQLDEFHLKDIDKSFIVYSLVTQIWYKQLSIQLPSTKSSRIRVQA